jgi:hypothetical protein
VARRSRKGIGGRRSTLIKEEVKEKVEVVPENMVIEVSYLCLLVCLSLFVSYAYLTHRM